MFMKVLVSIVIGATTNNAFPGLQFVHSNVLFIWSSECAELEKIGVDTNGDDKGRNIKRLRRTFPKPINKIYCYF